MAWITAVIAVFAAAALAAAVWNRLHARRVMKNLNRMLDAAMAGIFLERDFDESLLSAVESRFAYYLAANAVSAQKLQEEKDKIKTLIADISHQTKTPVANILLYTQLLSEQELSPEGRDCAAALEGQVEKLRALVERTGKDLPAGDGHPGSARQGRAVGAHAGGRSCSVYPQSGKEGDHPNAGRHGRPSGL